MYKLSRLLFIFAIIISGCSNSSEHPVHLKNVTNYVRKIEPTKDFAVLKEWHGVLQRQPIKQSVKTTSLSIQVIKQINESCNRKIYNVSPQWPTPKEFGKSLTGDCKGFTICKYYALREHGIPADNINIWSGDYNGTPHLMLVLKNNNKLYVMDAGDESGLPHPKDYFYKDFQPSYRFNEIGWDSN